MCTELENDFVSDTKRKHNYSKAAQKIPSAFGLRENYVKVPGKVAAAISEEFKFGHDSEKMKEKQLKNIRPFIGGCTDLEQGKAAAGVGFIAAKSLNIYT